jgi:hypothetical protein
MKYSACELSRLDKSSGEKFLYGFSLPLHRLWASDGVPVLPFIETRFRLRFLGIMNTPAPPSGKQEKLKKLYTSRTKAENSRSKEK